MEDGYYNIKEELVSKEEFDAERELIIAKRVKEAENGENLIDDKDLDFYLGELEKMSE